MTVSCEMGYGMLSAMSILVCFFLTILIVYLYFKRSFKYWDKKGVYVPIKPMFPFGSSQDLLLQKVSLGEMFWKVHIACQAKLERFCGFYFLTRPCFIIVDVNLIEAVLTTGFDHFTDRGFHIDVSDPFSQHLISMKGEQWKNARGQLSPVFTNAKIRIMFPTMCKYTDDLINVIDHLVEKESSVVDVHELLNRLTIDVFSSCAFGIESSSLKDPNSQIAHYLRLFSSPSIFDSVVRLAAVVWPNLLTIVKVRSIPKSLGNFFLKTISESIKYREANHIVRNDFLHWLLQMRNKPTDNGNLVGTSLTETSITAHSIVFFIAGYETISSAITFCLYEFAVNISVQDNAREEVTRLAKGGLTYDAVMSMPYLEKCIQESLRKYSPAPIILRECTKNYSIPGTGVVIEKGTAVIISTMGIHLDSTHYTKPEIFDPERFSTNNVAKRPPASFVPFGYGPRRCIGVKFAMLESKTCLAKLLMRFKFSANSRTEVPAVYDPIKLSTSPKNGIWLTVEKIIE